jgi:hypothetical protein
MSSSLLVGEGWGAFPSPLVGEGQGGGEEFRLRMPYPPQPSPTRGEEVWSASPYASGSFQGEAKKKPRQE